MNMSTPLPILLAALLAAPAFAHPMGHPAAATPAATATAPAAPKLQATLRSLWHGHVVHARAYAQAVHAGNTANATKAANDVVANARQLANAVGSFYGDAAGKQMLTLLAGHWGAVKALTDARAKHDEAAATTAMNDLTANAGEIAKFLAGANPNWPEDTLRGLLLAHGAHHAQQIQQIMAGDKKGEADTWKAMQAHMDTIADALAAGIARQFPQKAA